MAVPQQPVRPAGQPPPRGIQPGQSLQTPKPGNTVSGSQVSVSPTATAARTNVRPTLKAKREKILLLGDTVTGKSYAYMRKAMQEWISAREVGRQPKKFFVIDTDDTMPTFLNDGDEFDYLYFENGGNVYPFPASNWEELRDAYATVRRQAETGDWIVFDLASRVYDMAQQVVAKIKGADLSDVTIQRAIDNKGFGAFDAAAWNLVTNTFESVIKDAIMNSPANIILLQHITEIIDVAGREGKREQLVMFDAVGYKPQGAPKIASMVDTVIMLYAIRQINRDERKQRINAKTVREMLLLKDRGKNLTVRATYDRDALDMLTELRKSYRAEDHQNITSPAEVAQLKADANASANPPDLTASVS